MVDVHPLVIVLKRIPDPAAPHPRSIYAASNRRIYYQVIEDAFAIVFVVPANKNK